MKYSIMIFLIPSASDGTISCMNYTKLFHLQTCAACTGEVVILVALSAGAPEKRLAVTCVLADVDMEKKQ
jgi:hypothetical protein